MAYTPIKFSALTEASYPLAEDVMFPCVVSGQNRRAKLVEVNRLRSYTVAGLPAAGTRTGLMVYVTDEVGGAVPAFSDGTNWLRVTDRAVVS